MGRRRAQRDREAPGSQDGRQTRSGSGTPLRQSSTDMALPATTGSDGGCPSLCLSLPAPGRHRPQGHLEVWGE